MFAVHDSEGRWHFSTNLLWTNIDVTALPMSLPTGLEMAFLQIGMLTITSP
jgi:hypothetical protein